MSVFLAIPMQPGTLECSKHRTISIMSQFLKVILRVRIYRMRVTIRREIVNEQFGFTRRKRHHECCFCFKDVGRTSDGSAERLIFQTMKKLSIK